MSKYTIKYRHVITGAGEEAQENHTENKIMLHRFRTIVNRIGPSISEFFLQDGKSEYTHTQIQKRKKTLSATTQLLYLAHGEINPGDLLNKDK